MLLTVYSNIKYGHWFTWFTSTMINLRKCSNRPLTGNLQIFEFGWQGWNIKINNEQNEIIKPSEIMTDDCLRSVFLRTTKVRDIKTTTEGRPLSLTQFQVCLSTANSRQIIHNHLLHVAEVFNKWVSFGKMKAEKHDKWVKYYFHYTKMVLKKIFLCREHITRLKIHVPHEGILSSHYLNILHKESPYTRFLHCFHCICRWNMDIEGSNQTAGCRYQTLPKHDKNEQKREYGEKNPVWFLAKLLQISGWKYSNKK